MDMEKIGKVVWAVLGAAVGALSAAAIQKQRQSARKEASPSQKQPKK